ncbi:hypothetical protein Cgig2_022687 [Carnegiea gigantea]|uniref:Uncharacterized protein n=1 Tax=Carnegiea gigantea TaxID=171969 RepID=A0A9Q1KBP6_9CARY|nr:hypothetical protein Cgig2_022687 [Carnegiea gigantea]
MTAKELKPLVGPTMTFGPKDMHPFEKDLEAVEALIIGFGGQPTYPLENKRLLVQVGDRDNSRTVKTNFLVMDIPTAYNVIQGRPTRNAIKAAVAPYLLLVQFELDDRKVGNYTGTKRCPWEGKKNPLSGEESRPPKIGKKSTTEAMLVLSTSAEEHGRPYLEPTCLERMLRNSGVVIWLVAEDSATEICSPSLAGGGARDGQQILV